MEKTRKINDVNIDDDDRNCRQEAELLNEFCGEAVAAFGNCVSSLFPAPIVMLTDSFSVVESSSSLYSISSKLAFFQWDDGALL